MTQQPFAPATRFRRFAAMVYDSFILFSFLLLLTALALIANQGEPLDAYPILFPLYLLISTGLFWSWFWKKGQTLGMLAWKIHCLDHHNTRITWSHAFKRYLMALLSIGLGGLGILWCLWDKDKQMLHDKWAKTRIVKIS